MTDDRLERQISFLIEMDRLKDVQRRSYISSSGRLENSAEHSWHVALACLLLGEYSNEEIDLPRTVAMLLVHDIVEIEAGDTYCYDEQARQSQHQSEEAAAEAIFSRLPSDQGAMFIDLWREFERSETPEARFANGMDRLIPLLQSSRTRGKSWEEHGVREPDVRRRNDAIKPGSESIWRYAMRLIDRAVEDGYLEP